MNFQDTILKFKESDDNVNALFERAEGYPPAQRSSILRSIEKKSYSTGKLRSRCRVGL